MQQHPQLSIIILNYNTAKLTVEAIASIEKNYPKEMSSGIYELIVADNASPDDSIKQLKAYKKTSKIKFFTIIENKENMGFAKGNNAAVPFAKGDYMLFLNSDTVMHSETLPTLLKFLQSHPDAGAVTCKIEIPTGAIDEASHRGFPTPWNSFCHFSGLEKLFPHSKLFAGYTQGWKDMNTIHTVDAITGAFLFVPRHVAEEIGYWDEDYFFYGEDLNFCFEIRERGYNIYYVPTVSILHYGGVSSGIKKQSAAITTANITTKTRIQNARFDAMRIFYRKHYMKKYPALITWLVMKGIDILHKRNLPKLSSEISTTKA